MDFLVPAESVQLKIQYSGYARRTRCLASFARDLSWHLEQTKPIVLPPESYTSRTGSRQTAQSNASFRSTGIEPAYVEYGTTKY